mgnify:FL=1
MVIRTREHIEIERVKLKIEIDSSKVLTVEQLNEKYETYLSLKKELVMISRLEQRHDKLDRLLNSLK